MLDDFDAVMPEVGGKLQPLHAVYRKTCANAIAALEASGENRRPPTPAQSTQERSAKKNCERSTRISTSFFNVNTAEDYQRALELARLSPYVATLYSFFSTLESGGARLALRRRARQAASAARS